MKSLFKIIFIFFSFLLSLSFLGGQTEISNDVAVNYIQNDYTKIVMVSQSSTPELSSYSDRTNFTLTQTPNASNNWAKKNQTSKINPKTFGINIHKLSTLLTNETSIRAP